ncbi:ribosome biogenesis GTPase Der [bacterium]|jgi:GTPase|nr:ribosome biogenesis GTPase Der [bacterium]MBT4122251.1 ribosome biogenesis GTPase Der [bacterium]MBT4496022.1 ribosome biogenesis GTPase Der [bacterium]MBT4763833.1 ribosome biogenesis GTPase Der [bacterium]MBT5401203.1 ribosome biogenesis GTPase Der [bacterium]
MHKVVLIGRANTGKSTLFNTLTEKRVAITSDIAGTTRDRNYQEIIWNSKRFDLVDTGGIDIVHPKDIEKDILRQADIAKKEANLILFLVDAKDGLMPQDKEVAAMLKKSKKKVILVVNKADNKKMKENVAEYYKLNLGDPYPISALNGTGTGDLLDEIAKNVANTKKQKPEKSIGVAILGKPNTGKSTLINSILGEDRVITSAEPYTTRDSQDIMIKHKGFNFNLIDTAGVRKKSKIRNKLEKFSVAQSIKSLERADITVLMTEASKKLGRQDKMLASEILKSNTSLIIAANKWDLIPDKDDLTINKYVNYYYSYFPFLSFAPIIFISALEKQRVRKLLDLSLEVYQERHRQITDNALNKFLKKVVKKHPPSRGKGTAKPKLFNLKQIGMDPPYFELVKDIQSDLKESYFKFIEKQLRAQFGFLGTPIIIKIRKIK